MKGLMRSHLE
ncbi:hypothetical protein A2U01_0068272, partial [Trifolium medium]|nr:hypothetical protein [Trifolium medium]